VDDCDPAQAAELIRALRDLVRERSHHLSWIEGRYVPGVDGNPMRLEAAALRRDLAEAQNHIDRLQRRYLSHTTDNPADLHAGTAAHQSYGRSGLVVR
jgi:protein involved in temperature-dependent protein secretion